MEERLVEALVGPEADGTRLDVFLGGVDSCPSRSACAKLIESGAVTINGTLAMAKSERVALGDRVAVRVPEPKAQGPLAPCYDIPLDVRWEDDRFIVISKQAGLVCHPAPGHDGDTLSNVLVGRYGYGRLGLLQGDDRPGIVHRLDADTSGLMLAAKDDEIQNQLQDLIRLRTLDRRYVTLVHGVVAPDEGRIESGIRRSSRDRLRMAVTDDPLARQAITTFRTLERFEPGPRDDGYALLECHLYTGRTHQIRVHMAHIHHAVVGDPAYGHGDLARNRGLARQFLHSWRIEFDHPATGEHLLLHDGLPTDLAEVLAGLSGRSMGRTAAGEEVVPRLLRATA